MKPVFEITYDWIEATLRGHRDALQRERFDFVVSILRGGSMPGFVCAQMLDAPLIFLDYDRGAGQPSWHSQPPKRPSKVLLVDDIAGEGFTLTNSKRFLEQAGFTVQTLTVGYDERSRMVPDFSTDLSERILVFPWERHRLHPDFVGALQTGEIKADSVYERVGLDLDGVFLPDLPDDDYTIDLEATLVRRDGLAPFDRELLPAFDPVTAVIVTGRPVGDEARTRAWLARHGLGGLTLVMRDDAIFPHRHSGKFKAQAARALGVTRFFESDLLQATQMTHYCPLLDVFCWNNDRGVRIRLGPAKLLFEP